jgi:hypothetical protein
MAADGVWSKVALLTRLEKKAGQIPLHPKFYFAAAAHKITTHRHPTSTVSKMTESSSKPEQGLETLKSTVATTLQLLAQLQESAPSPQDAGTTSSKINALDLAHDTASLIRAHSTKLSLLIINKPFTASAITTVLRELVSGPLPGLASSVELCDAARYTKAMSSELQYRAKRVFVEFATLVKAIPLDGNILTDDQKNGTGTEKGKGSLASTGVVWEACDGVIELKKLGVAGLIIRKVEEYKDLLKDALEELQKWGEEESDDDDGEANLGSDDGEPDDTQAAVDQMFASERHISAADPDKIRPRLESSQKRLRLLILMYQAVVKRRFKTLPQIPSPETPTESKENPEEDRGIVECLDEVLNVMKKIPDITDELASAFYDLDSKEIDQRMDQCFFTGFAAVELLIKNWDSQKDEFSTWVSSSLTLSGKMSLIEAGI